MIEQSFSVGHVVTVGRVPSFDVVFKDPKVSRKHLSLVLADSRVHMRDLCSENGTAVNGQRRTSCVLAEGDVITCGSGNVILCRVEDDGKTLVVTSKTWEEELPG
jgi:pSer/pThr/pTyr-binding forkhead associated (FHA) protein